MSQLCDHGLPVEAVCERCDRERPIEMIRQLRDALGNPPTNSAQSPREVWEESLRHVRRLAGEKEGGTMTTIEAVRRTMDGLTEDQWCDRRFMEAIAQVWDRAKEADPSTCAA